MATEQTAEAVTFSSPSMRARASLVRGLALVDELERAWARQDYWSARHFAGAARDHLQAAQEAFTEAWGHTDTLEALEAPEPADVPPGLTGADMAAIDPAPIAESEARLMDGNR